MAEIKSILVVEDQKWPRCAINDGLADAFKELNICPVLQHATCLDEARAILDKEQPIDVILLDHRMPKTPQGTLEDTDFDAFCATLHNVGYSLIPGIREQHPEAVIIGTSSMSSELKNYPHKPDESIDKSKASEHTHELSPLLRRILERE
jgi:CheY-like chemotaxis protein